jgi:hypothetical protein
MATAVAYIAKSSLGNNPIKLLPIKLARTKDLFWKENLGTESAPPPKKTSAGLHIHRNL